MLEDNLIKSESRWTSLILINLNADIDIGLCPTSRSILYLLPQDIFPEGMLVIVNTLFYNHFTCHRSNKLRYSTLNSEYSGRSISLSNERSRLA